MSKQQTIIFATLTRNIKTMSKIKSEPSAIKVKVIAMIVDKLVVEENEVTNEKEFGSDLGVTNC